MKRAMCCVLVALWSLSCLVSADARAQLASETGLDADLVGLVTLDVAGTELTIVFVFITERTFQSKISADLASALRPYIGRNAVYVNPSVDSVVSSFAFDSQSLAVEQAGATRFPPWDAWDEITPGFLSGRFEVNPSGPERGSGSEGVVILGDLIDVTRPFDLLYAGQRATFAIGSAPPVTQGTTGSPTAAAPSHDPIAVAPVGTLDTLQELLLHEDFSSEAMAALFRLDAALVRTLVLSLRGAELRLFFVRLEDAVRDSLLGEDLIAALEDVVGTGSVMVWAISPDGVDFSPWNFYIKQGGTNYVFFSYASFVELTEGFLRVERVEAGDMVAGVIRLPRGVDPDAAFSVHYGTSGISYP